MSDYRSTKITLPGGREIEIVYLGDVRPETLDASRAGEIAHELDEMLHAALTVFDRERPEMWLCGSCPGDMVRPLVVEPADGGTFRVERMCPDCGWHDDGTFTHEQVESYHDALEEGAEEMLTALRTMSRLNMEDDVDRIITAIRCDLIQPMDF
ncbi:MAG: hypothetical protein ACLGG9_05040 [Thermoleophilia bacterium]|jgi:hypothetical protein